MPTQEPSPLPKIIRLDILQPTQREKLGAYWKKSKELSRDPRIPTPQELNEFHVLRDQAIEILTIAMQQTFEEGITQS